MDATAQPMGATIELFVNGDSPGQGVLAGTSLGTTGNAGSTALNLANGPITLGAMPDAVFTNVGFDGLLAEVLVWDDALDASERQQIECELGEKYGIAVASCTSDDFGDAPLPYPTTLITNGARHVAVGPSLGANRDAESDGQPTADAGGDDITGTPDDEDGVTFTTILAPGLPASIDVVASQAGHLDAWIDFGDDGSWTDAGDQIFANKSLNAGTNTLYLTVPAGATVTDRTYARFRISSAGNLPFEGPADDGEVEDYPVEIVFSPTQLAGRKFEDVNANSIDDLAAEGSFVGAFDTLTDIRVVQVEGDLAYVAAGVNGLHILDASDPSAPTLVASVDTPNLTTDVEVVGHLAYVADWARLLILDVSNPASPTLVGSFATPIGTYRVDVVGNLAYLGDTSNARTLRIVDVSDPAEPTLAGSYVSPNYIQEVQVVGNLAYLASYDSGLLILDVSTPATPVLVGSYNTPSLAQGVHVVSDVAYVADYASGLQIVDVSIPASPVLLGSSDTAGFAQGVQVVGNLAYVADDANGLQIIDVSGPTVPFAVSGSDTPGLALNVDVVDGLVYIADHNGGLQIVSVREPGIGGVQIELFLDGGDGLFGSDGAGAHAGTGLAGDDDVAVDTTTTADISGHYALTVDQTGTYFVRETVPADHIQTAPAAGFHTVPVTLAESGSEIPGLDFGNNQTNAPPTTTGIANVNVLEDTADTVIDLFAAFEDAENLDTALTFSVESNTNIGLFDSTDMAAGALTLDYAPDANGTADIRVRATDTGGLFVETTFTVTVAAVNDEPSVTMLGDQAVNEDSGAHTVAGFATPAPGGGLDEAGQTFSYNVSVDNPSLFAVLPAIDGNGQLTYTLEANANGTTNVMVSVTDSGGTANGGEDTSPTQSFQIIVLSAEQQTQQMVDDVQALKDAGDLGNGQANPVLNFLDQALKDLDKGKTSQAVKKLGDFVDRIQDFLDDGTLTLSQGQPLIDAANTAIQSAL